MDSDTTALEDGDGRCLVAVIAVFIGDEDKNLLGTGAEVHLLCGRAQGEETRFSATTGGQARDPAGKLCGISSKAATVFENRIAAAGGLSELDKTETKVDAAVGKLIGESSDIVLHATNSTAHAAARIDQEDDVGKANTAAGLGRRNIECLIRLIDAVFCASKICRSETHDGSIIVCNSYIQKEVRKELAIEGFQFGSERGRSIESAHHQGRLLGHDLGSYVVLLRCTFL